MKSADKDKSDNKCYTIHISNNSSDDLKDSPYWWNAVHEFGNKLIDLGYGKFVMAVSPEDKSCNIMISYDNWPDDKGDIFSDDAIVKMAWDLQKEFDYLISCKIDSL